MVYRGGCGSRLDDEYASLSVTMSDRGRFELEHRGRSNEMAHFVGLDVSVKETSVCVVDAAGTVILEQKVTTEPAGPAREPLLQRSVRRPFPRPRTAP